MIFYKSSFCNNNIKNYNIKKGQYFTVCKSDKIKKIQNIIQTNNNLFLIIYYFYLIFLVNIH